MAAGGSTPARSVDNRSRTPDPLLVVERLTEKQLLAAARRQGCKVSPDQLKRWRRAELLPRPDQTHSVGQRGSEATYPPGTLTQLLTVCELRTRFKKLDRIRFELWWSGHYEGGTAPIRAFLAAELEPPLAELRELRDRFGDPVEAAEAAVAGPISNLRHPGLRAMRRRVKDDENLRSVMYALLLDLFGGEVPWDHDTRAGLAVLLDLFGASVISEVGALEPSLRDLAERASGFERAKTDELDSGTTLFPADANFVDTIRTLFSQRLFDLDDPGWAIRKATDEELETARTRARLVTGLSRFARLVATGHGRDYAGLSFLNVTDLQDPTIVALLTQHSLLIPSLWAEEPGTIYGSRTLDALAAQRDVLACSELFLKELPRYAFLLTPDAQSRLESMTTEEQQLTRQTVNAFLDRHPECRTAMTLTQ